MPPPAIVLTCPPPPRTSLLSLFSLSSLSPLSSSLPPSPLPLSSRQVAIRNLTAEQIAEYEANKSLVVAGVELVEGDIAVKQEFTGDAEKFEAAANDKGDLLVVVDLEMTEEIRNMAVVREVASTLQGLRKNGGLVIGQASDAFITVESDDAAAAQAMLAVLTAADINSLSAATAVEINQAGPPAHAVVIAEETVSFAEGAVKVLCRMALPSVVLASDDVLRAVVQGGDAAVVELVKTFVTSMDLASLPKGNGADDGVLACAIQGATVSLRQGEHFWTRS